MKPNNPSRGNPPTAQAKRQARANAEPSPVSAAAPSGKLKCAVCHREFSGGTAVLHLTHLTHLKNEKSLKLEVCDSCAEDIVLNKSDDMPTPAPVQEGGVPNDGRGGTFTYTEEERSDVPDFKPRSVSIPVPAELFESFSDIFYGADGGQMDLVEVSAQGLGNTTAAQTAGPTVPKEQPAGVAASSKAPVCAVCNVAAATLHLTQLKNEKLRKLDVCDECAAAFHLIPPVETPTPPRAAVPAAASQTFLSSLERRESMLGKSPGRYHLTLPGVGLMASFTEREVLDEMSMALYVGESGIKEHVLSRLPAWEAVEMAELVSISNHMREVPRLEPGETGVWRTRLPCGSLDTAITTGDLLLHYCSLLHHHATLLSEHLIPQLPFTCEAVRLSRALAMAEQVLAQAGDAEAKPGTVASPSPLLQRALALHAAALLRAEEGMSRDSLKSDTSRPTRDDLRIGQRLGIPGTEPKVAA